MKQINPLIIVILFLLSIFLISCEAVKGIFEAGMGFGIFIVIALIAIVIFIVAKLMKK